MVNFFGNPLKIAHTPVAAIVVLDHTSTARGHDPLSFADDGVCPAQPRLYDLP
jgi:hypothetical protein